MKNITKIFALVILMAVCAFSQTVTPNTTLCGPVSATTLSICLTSTTNIVNQTGLYIDAEYMTVLLSNSQVLPAGPTQVPVSRSNRAGYGGPAVHANGAIVWEQLVPSSTIIPGVTGFSLSTNLGGVTGPCTRANITYLPAIFPNLNVMRDCNQNAQTTLGQWVNYNDGNNTQNGSPTPLVALTTNGALTVTTGNYIITKAGVLAMTLAAPTAGIQDGTLLVITSGTANAHTLTATGLLSTGSASVNVATFAAFAGASVTLKAYQGKWVVVSQNAITFS